MKRVHTQPLERLLTLSLALAIPLASTPALAASALTASGQDPVEDPQAATPEDAQLVEAQRLYKLGEARYELFDFPAAIEFWTEAYGLLPEGENARIRNVLVRNLSLAHRKAYDVDDDVKHLKAAKMLLERYVQELTTYYEGESDTANEIGEANKTLDEVNAKLEELKEKEEAAAAAAAAAKPPPTTGGDPADRDAPIPVGPQVDDEGMRKAKVLMGTGGALLGLGIIAGGVGLLGAINGEQAAKDAQTVPAADRPDEIQKGNTGNLLAYTGAAAGGTFLIIGVVLIAMGAKKKKEAQSASLRPRIAPQLTRTSAGATLSLEF